MTITERDPETGRIIKKELTSEQAREMGKRSHQVQPLKSAEKILSENGFDPETAPELMKKLAEFSAKGNVQALRLFMQETGKPAKEASTGCPMWPGCNYYALLFDDWRKSEHSGKDAAVTAAKARLQANREAAERHG